MSKTLQFTVAVSVGLLAAYGLLFVLDTGPVDAYVEEDGVVETLGAVALLATSILFAITLFRYRNSEQMTTTKKVALVLLALLFFFGAGEEISWGQRIFGIDTPAGLAQENAQEEINVHNLRALGGWLEAGRLFKIFWLCFGIVLPLVAAVSERVRAFAGKLVPILPLGIAIALVVNQAIAELITMIADRSPSLYAGTIGFAQARFEVTEAMVAVIFVFGAFALFKSGPGNEPAEGHVDLKVAERPAS